MNDFVGNNL